MISSHRTMASAFSFFFWQYVLSSALFASFLRLACFFFRFFATLPLLRFFLPQPHYELLLFRVCSIAFSLLPGLFLSRSNELLFSLRVILFFSFSFGNTFFSGIVREASSALRACLFGFCGPHFLCAFFLFFFLFFCSSKAIFEGLNLRFKCSVVSNTSL